MCVGAGLELNSAGLWPFRNWLWHPWCSLFLDIVVQLPSNKLQALHVVTFDKVSDFSFFSFYYNIQTTITFFIVICKMAPMCVAGRRAGTLFVCVCMMLLVWLACLTQVAALLSYDWNQLLLIKPTADEVQIIDYLRTDHSPPPVLANIPSELWRSPYDHLLKNHRRKKGCRGCFIVKLKFFEAHWSWTRQMATLCRVVPVTGLFWRFGILACLGETVWMDPPDYTEHLRSSAKARSTAFAGQRCGS